MKQGSNMVASLVVGAVLGSVIGGVLSAATQKNKSIVKKGADRAVKFLTDTVDAVCEMMR